MIVNQAVSKVESRRTGVHPDSGRSSVNALSELSGSEVSMKNLLNEIITNCNSDMLRLKRSSRGEVLAATQSPPRPSTETLEQKIMKDYLFIHYILLPNLFAFVLYSIPELPALTTSVSYDI